MAKKKSKKNGRKDVNAPPSLDVTEGDSFILFRENGEFLMHIGQTNQEVLNKGGYLASFCSWAVGRDDWHKEFGSFLEKLSEVDGVDTAVEAGVSLAVAEKS